MTLLRRPGAAMTALLLLLMGAAFLTQVVPTRQILDSHRQVNVARAQLEQLETDNTRLQADVIALGTDGEIEKLAREKLGYVRPGEIAYVVLDPAEQDRVQTNPLPLSVLPERQTWVDEVWDFLTGADLES